LFLLNPAQKKRSETKKGVRSALLNFVEVRLKAFNTVKIFNRQVPELRQFQKLNDRVLTTSKSDLVLTALVEGILPVFFFGVLGLVLVYISSGSTDVGMSSTMLVFVLLMLYMQSAFKRILKLPTIWLLGRSSLQSLIDILNLKMEVQANEESKLSFRTKSINLEGVSFSYPNGPQIFNLFSAQFESDKITFVDGKGKSTLMKLLLGLEIPGQGRLHISNHDYNTISPKEIRKQIAYVGAEAPLLGNSVFNAISYSRAPENRIEAADMLKRVQLHLESSDDVLNFKLEPDARNISSSERKKLQFARALLTGKKILLLDEPFVDTDNQTKIILLNLLNSLRGQLTIVIAANDIPEGLIIDKWIKL
ncbi:MAG: ATP-binding cassette domain-containing protein, partial [Flavobacteriales bacterium]